MARPPTLGNCGADDRVKLGPRRRRRLIVAALAVGAVTGIALAVVVLAGRQHHAIHLSEVESSPERRATWLRAWAGWIANADRDIQRLSHLISSDTAGNKALLER